MSNILTQLYAAKALALAEEEAREPFADIAERAERRLGERRSFRGALEAGVGFGLIAEVKQASPSLGRIVADFDPAAIAAIYDRAGVDGVSVLTEASGFHGELRFLDIVRAHTTRPLIRKDFLTTPYQVAQSAAYGADAILLIVAGLDDAQLTSLLAEARRYRLDALVEVHDEHELTRARAAGATLIGVNNRDLRTFTVDLAVTERLVPLMPAGALVVSESGLASSRDIARLRGAGAHAFLIGEALMRSDDPVALVDALRSAVAT